MNDHEGWGRPHLEIVRNHEELPEDLRVIDAYCDELLMDKNGLKRNYAYFSQTPFAHADSEWSRVVLRRDKDSYTVTFYGESEYDPLFENSIGAPVYEIDMRPYRTVYPGVKAPNGAQWYIQAGRPEANAPTDTSTEPLYFRRWLEEIWGPLPRAVQKQLGITQTPHSV